VLLAALVTPLLISPLMLPAVLPGRVSLPRGLTVATFHYLGLMAAPWPFQT